MRVYLDTNILAFLVGQDKGESISRDVMELLQDYEVVLLSSAVCFQELVHLVQIGKLRRPDCRDVGKAAAEALQVLEDYGIKMMPVSEKHIRRLVELPLYEDNRDPNDRLIIAQAICDRIPLVSSDQKFVRYGRYGLELIFNRR